MEMLSILFLLALSFGAPHPVWAAARPAPVFPLAVQERPAPYAPSHPPRVSRRKMVSLEALPGNNAYEKLGSLFERPGSAPSKSELDGFQAGWLAFAGQPKNISGALLVRLTPISEPQAPLNAYDHLTYADAEAFQKSVTAAAKSYSTPSVDSDGLSYEVLDGPFKNDRYLFRRIREGIVMRLSRPGQGDVLYAFFFKKVLPVSK